MTTNATTFVDRDTPVVAAWLNDVDIHIFGVKHPAYGAVGDGVTDDTTAIQAAITAAQNAGGGIVYVPPGTYKITSTLTITANNVVLTGAGEGWSQNGTTTDYISGASILSWAGSNGGCVVRVTSTEGGTTAVKGSGLERIGIACNSLAGYGLQVKTVKNGIFRNITVYEAITRGVDFTVVSSISPDTSDNQSCTIDEITVVNQLVTSGDCIWFDGDSTGNTSLNNIGHLKVLYYNGNGVTFGSSDGNHVAHLSGFKFPSGTGLGLVFKAGSSISNHARKNVINYCQTGSGGAKAEGTPSNTTASTNNIIQFYSLANGSTTPTIETGAQLDYYTETGVINTTNLSVGGGTAVKKILQNSASLDFPSVAAGGTQSLTITVTGAQTFDTVAIGLPANGGNAGLVYSAYVSAADTVTVRCTNNTAGAIDPANQTFRVTVFNYT